jgi:sporulation protein YlmC with PRC-barrel domain
VPASEGPARLSLSALVGRPVTASTRSRVGWLRDLVVDLGSPSTSVSAAVLGDFRDRWRVPWTDLAVEPPGTLRLTGGAGVRSEQDPPTLVEHEHEHEHELMLVRDVLDTRVYDVSGRRTTRVGDVWLDLQPDGSLVVAGLEVGAEVLLRRLGLRRQNARAVRLVPLSRVHLTSPHGHRVQLVTPSSSVHALGDADLAHLLTHLPTSAAADLVRQLPDDEVSQAVEHLHPQVVSRLDHALDADAGPRRRWRRTAGWRLYRPRDDDRSAEQQEPGSPA